jgi:integrase
MKVNLEINSKPKADGSYQVLLRMVLNGAKKRIDSGYSISKAHWKKRAGQRRYYLSKSAPNYTAIEKSRFELEKRLNEILEENPVLELQALFDHYLNGNKKSIGNVGFFQFAVDFINRVHNEGRTGYAKNLMTGVRNFAVFNFGKEIVDRSFLEGNPRKDLSFKAVTAKKLTDFEHWLNVRELKVNTVKTNLKTLRTIYNKAINEEVFNSSSSPFKVIKFRYAVTEKKALELKDIKKLEECKLKDEKLKVALDMFLLSFYCAGLRWGDVCTLKWSDLKGEYLHVIPRKTSATKQKANRIKLDQRAIQIVNGYKRNTNKPDDYIFPIVQKQKTIGDLLLEIGKKNALINKRLKDVASFARVKVKLSFHMTRHTYATLALQKNVPLAAISQLLGHSDLKTTQIYLKELDHEQVIDAHMSILDY